METRMAAAATTSSGSGNEQVFSEVPPSIQPHQTLTSDFCSPEPGENTFVLLSPLRRWHFVRAASGN